MVGDAFESRKENVLKRESKGSFSRNFIGLLKQFFSGVVLISRQLGWLALVGLVLTAGLFLLFAWLTEEVFSNEFAGLDRSILLGVHGLANSSLDTFFVAVTTIGGTVGVIVITALVCGFLLWRKFYYFAVLTLLAVGGGSLLYVILKQIFQRTRPSLFTGPLAPLQSYSFPSGHSTMAVCVYGMLIFLNLFFLKNRVVQLAITIICLAMILLIGLSRVYLGAHYPTDVLAGFFTGGCWLGFLLSGQHIARITFLKRDKVKH